MLKVGIVDSGCSVAQQGRASQQAAFVLADDQLWLAEAEPDQLGHGTMITERIYHHLPDAELLVAQVFHYRFTTTAAQVAAAIDWLVAVGAQLINLSLGLRTDRQILRDAVERALEAGVVLSASSPARGDPVYPSAYPGVFRMTGEARCETAQQWSCLETEFADFGGYVRSLDGSQSGASLGAAAMTAHLGGLMLQYPEATREQLYQHLKHGAAYYGPERRGPEEVWGE